ncbi:MAG: PD-(D/E)XK nuclease family protein [Chroococcidiopsidaceae cyanobacterium CP_BM_ER_R8_30]|nr:PD-(D/E)XK nuclease family protein [Chroococcidiopsidaceae cyanobacterium CP_BM_ER_R8_30]
MPISKRLFASYNLWSLVAPAVGQERWHCQMKRGFIKARQHEPAVKALLAQATPPQRIGLLAQKGVYEFHQHTQLLQLPDGVERVAQLLRLSKSASEVQQRVIQILKNYRNAPVLVGKRIVLLTRGDEGFPRPIPIKRENYRFQLYASMDCIFTETDRTLHILDFKTGKSAFDRRQALVYLLAARYLYPQHQAVASFYNLEQCKQSDLIHLTSSQLDGVETQLALVAQKHQQDLSQYRQNPHEFSQVFPANPGFHCRHCPFHSICEFSAVKQNMH